MLGNFVNRLYEKKEPELRRQDIVNTFVVLSYLGVESIIIDNYGKHELIMHRDIYNGLFNRFMPMMNVKILCNDEDRESNEQ